MSVDSPIDTDAFIPPDDYVRFADIHLPLPPDLEQEEFAAHTWHILDWRRLEKRVLGPQFEAGGVKWRPMLFPLGNNSGDNVSLFLEVEPPQDAPPDWHICCQYLFVLWNPADSTYSKIGGILIPQHQLNPVASHHRFHPDETDWGYSRFCESKRLFSPDDESQSLLVGDRINLSTYVRVVKDPTGILWHDFKDSKKETGHVGLRNQGATCYMNSILQSLYYTNMFRKAVFQIPTEKDEPTNSIALALQRVFYLLQSSTESVGTTELTRSFGWDSLDSFMQHDVQEFNRVLQDNLEGKMKNTAAENALAKLFVGKMKSFIKCVNVDFESSRAEDFWDIQLNVKGMKDVYESFRDYVQVETLDGDNKYFAEGFGLQDAKKGVIFLDLPPVLHLQLKRFEYDMIRDTMVKINDRYEFPDEIDLDEFVKQEIPRSCPFRYKLHGVLVHSGDLHGGHYYALVKPEKDGEWFKYDDDRVTRATMAEVFDDNFGGDGPLSANTQSLMRHTFNRNITNKRYSNAYMLVYIREHYLDKVLAPVTESDIPTHLKQRLEEERIASEARRKEKEEAHLFMYVRVLQLEDFKKHQGFDLGLFEDSDNSSTCTPSSNGAGSGVGYAVKFKVPKASTFVQFKQRFSEEYNLSSQLFRFWICVNRQNKTVRPDIPILDSEDESSNLSWYLCLLLAMESLANRLTNGRPELRLWLETLPLEDSPSLTPPLQSNGSINHRNILIFCKCFDVVKQELFGFGSFYVDRMSHIGDFAVRAKKALGWPDSTPIKIFEEIKPGMIEPLNLKSSFYEAELQDGDIICFQQVLPEEEALTLQRDAKFTLVPQFYDFLINRVTVWLKPRFIDGEYLEEFTLHLNKKMYYNSVANKVAEELGVDPAFLRFTNAGTNSHPSKIIKKNATTTLQQMLQPNYLQPILPVLYYEVLAMPLDEFETKRYMRLIFLPKGLSREEHVDVLVSKNGTVRDAVQAMIDKLHLEVALRDGIFRVYDVQSNKLFKVLPLETPLSGILEQQTLYIELFNEDEDLEEQGLTPGREIRCFHFQKDISRTHGVPFNFLVLQGELFKDTKRRLLKRTKFDEKEFSRIKFAVVHSGSFGKVEYLEDDDSLWDRYTESSDFLGFDHVDKYKSSRYGDRAAIHIRN